ncbi:hypothetical protein JL720_15318 [Aureococcus anophagefferens]|nr:hypothetical protein JL720_15318 [Aureococcus anophagefferens]
MSITCTSCGDVLEPAGFSKNQLRTPKTARCRCNTAAAAGGRARGARRRGPAAAAAEEAEALRRSSATSSARCRRAAPPRATRSRSRRTAPRSRSTSSAAPATRSTARRRSRCARVAAATKARRALTCVAAAAAAAAPAGEVCVFEVAAAVRDAVDALGAAPARAAAEAAPAGGWTFEPACPQFGQRPVRFDAASGDDAHAVEIFDGEPVTDRRSTFQAFLAVGVDSLDKAQWAFRAILARNKCGRATHNMRAYRFTDAAGVRRADNDSDGEDGAGEKMAYLLDVLDADGVAVVVSR